MIMDQACSLADVVSQVSVITRGYFTGQDLTCNRDLCIIVHHGCIFSMLMLVSAILLLTKARRLARQALRRALS